jgi:hypothetical protein
MRVWDPEEQLGPTDEQETDEPTGDDGEDDSERTQP